MKMLILTFDPQEMKKFETNNPDEYEVWDYELVSNQIGNPTASFLCIDGSKIYYELHRQDDFKNIIIKMKKAIPSLTFNTIYSLNCTTI